MVGRARCRYPGEADSTHRSGTKTAPARQHVVLNNGDPAGIAVLVAKPFEDPLLGMPLFPRPALIVRQDTVDDPGEWVELRTRRWSPPPVRRRNRERQHLGYCPRIDPKLPRRFPSAQTLDLYGVPNPSIKLHYLHPQPSAGTPNGDLAAVILLRRNRIVCPLLLRIADTALTPSAELPTAAGITSL